MTSIIKTAKVRDAIAKTTRMIVQDKVEVAQRGAQPMVQYSKTGRVERIVLPVIPDDPSQEFMDAMQGYVDHEGAHVLFTDNRPFMELAEKAHKAKLRINAAMAAQFKGSAYNIMNCYRAVYTKIEPMVIAAKQIADPVERAKMTFGTAIVPWTRAVLGDVDANIFMNKHDLWPAFEGTNKAFPNYGPRLAAMKSSQDAADLAWVFFEAVQPPPPPPTPPSEEEPEDKKDPKEGEKSEGEKQEPNEDKDSGGEGDDTDEEAEGKGTGEEHDEAPEEEDAPTEPGDQEEGPDGDASEEDGDSEEEGEQHASGADAEDEDADDGEDEADEADGGGEDEAEAESEGRGGEGETESEADGEDEEEAEDGGEEEGSGPAGTGGEEEDGEDEEEGDTEAEGQPGKDDAGSPGGGTPEPEPEAAAPEEEPADTGEEKELEGEPLSEEESRIVNSAMSDIKDLDEIMADVIAVMLPNEFSGNKYVEYTRDWDKIEAPPAPADAPVEKWEEAVQKVSGTMQKDLQRIITARSQSIMVGGYRRGRINPSSLHRLESGDDRVFRRKFTNDTKDVAVQLVCDNSGSMSGPKMKLAMESAWAFSAVLDRLNIANEVIGFTTGDLPEDFGSDPRPQMAEQLGIDSYYDIRIDPIYMPVYKDFGERFGLEQKRRISAAQDMNTVELGNNIDGTSVLYAANRLLARREKRKLMIVFSDGQPAGSSEMGILRTHLRWVVGEIEKAGIEAIGVGIKSEAVKEFYPKHFVVNDLAELPGKVLGELRQFLLK
jgi:cobalamin biosynthesis protein CobT